MAATLAQVLYSCYQKTKKGSLWAPLKHNFKFWMIKRGALLETTANKQIPILMHMKYLVSLFYNVWVVAVRHKFVPSVVSAK